MCLARAGLKSELKEFRVGLRSNTAESTIEQIKRERLAAITKQTAKKLDAMAAAFSGC